MALLDNSCSGSSRKKLKFHDFSNCKDENNRNEKRKERKMTHRKSSREKKKKKEEEVKIKSIVDIAKDCYNSTLPPINPLVETLRTSFPNIHNFSPDKTKLTDIPDCLIANNLINVKNNGNNFMKSFHNTHGAHLQSQDVFIGPVGMISMLCYQPLDFGRLLVHGSLPHYSSLEYIWLMFDNVQRELLSLAKSSTTAARIEHFKEAWEKRRQIFLAENLSLYERLVVLCHALLTLHVFVYFTMCREMSTDSQGYLIKNLIDHHKLWNWRVEHKSLEQIRAESWKIRRKINAIEKISKEVLSKHYRYHLNLSLMDKTLPLVPVVINDTKMLINGHYADLHNAIQFRRGVIFGTTTIQQKKTLKPHSSSSIIREIRIVNVNKNCFFFQSSNDMVGIYFQSGLGSYPLEGGEQQKKEPESSPRILSPESDALLYYDDDDRDYFDPELSCYVNESDEEETLENIAEVRDTTTTELRKQYKKPRLMRLIYDFVIVEYFDEGHGIEEAMVVESLVNRDQVEFAGSKYEGLTQSQLLRGPTVPLRTCRIIKFPARSEMGLRSIVVGRKELKPSPVSFVMSLMMQLCLGKWNLCRDRDFVTLPESTMFGEKKTKYAKVTFIPPTRVTDLVGRNDYLKSFRHAETILDYIVKQYAKKTTQYRKDLEIVFKSLLEPGNGVNYLISEMSAVAFNLRNKNKKDFWLTVVNNMMIAVQCVRNIKFSLYKKY